VSFEDALLDAIPFLQNLPRVREHEKTARARLTAFRLAHPGVDVDLVVDAPPGSPAVDFDLLLRRDADGTLAVGWRPDGGNPWSVPYSEHWASNLVLTVNHLDLTVQDALQALRVGENVDCELPTHLVNHCLIAAEILKDPPAVSDAELQIAADAFRSARGLHSAEVTTRWLSEAGLSMNRFEELLKTTVQARKLKERIATDRVRDYFVSHAEDLAMITMLRAHAESEESLPDLTGLQAEVVARALECATGIDSRVRICVETGLPARVFPSLPADSRDPVIGTVIGPVRHDGEYWCGRILRRLPSRWDRETRAFVEERLFATWLEEERAKADIVWHWM
jgi:putative peptide maturation system protein